MSIPTRAWFHSLAESVSALGAAVREYRAAHAAARVTSWHIHPLRVLSAEGTVRVLGRDHIRPHDDALLRLGDLSKEMETRIEKLYEDAALAYAYGTSSAVLAVVQGGRPSHLALGRRDGLYERPAASLPDLREHLGHWARSARLASLRQRLTERERAAVTVRELSFFADLADYESAETTEAAALAAGLADSAYAYGELAETALHHVLISYRTTTTAEESP
ncbi:hypothetical protein AB0D49_08015 [Streptomyces sp. NPDC048290]|uniref:hypothetical protein n=1 Tax=Streptomyces sp. NPDC048290 TaxID=3155811 RepID=UPI00343BD481